MAALGTVTVPIFARYGGQDIELGTMNIDIEAEKVVDVATGETRFIVKVGS